MPSMPSWKTYEEVSAYLLGQARDQLGLDKVEGKQDLAGFTGVQYEIDAKGVRSSDDLVVIIECKRHTTRGIEQDVVCGLAFRILDTGAGGGILVSPLGLQEGAAKIAGATGIIAVTLNADATTSEFTMRFLNHLRVGVPSLEATAEVGDPVLGIKQAGRNDDKLP